MLELFLFEIDVEKQKDTQRKKKERKKQGVQKLFFLILLFTKH
jgi:hypothetical protein